MINDVIFEAKLVLDLGHSAGSQWNTKTSCSSLLDTWYSVTELSANGTSLAAG